MKINMQNHEQVKIKQKIDKQKIVCLVLITFKEQVDKLKLVELSN